MEPLSFSSSNPEIPSAQTPVIHRVSLSALLALGTPVSSRIPNRASNPPLPQTAPQPQAIALVAQQCLGISSPQSPPPLTITATPVSHTAPSSVASGETLTQPLPQTVSSQPQAIALVAQQHLGTPSSQSAPVLSITPTPVSHITTPSLTISPSITAISAPTPMLVAPTPPLATPTVETAVTAIQNAAASEHPQQALNQLFTTTERTVFAHAVRLVFKRNLPSVSKERLRQFLIARFPGQQCIDYRTSPIIFYRENGISTIINHLQSRDTPAISMPCTSGHAYDCIQTIERVITRNEITTNTPQTFIALDHSINHDDLFLEGQIRDSGHMIPLLLYRLPNGVYRILITDSLGVSEYGGLLTDMQHMQARLEAAGHTVQVFHFPQKRQNDHFSCSIFSLHDVVQYNKNIGRLNNIIEENLRRFDISASSGHVPLMPIGFHLPTQSLSTINEYIQTYRETGVISEEELARFQRHLARSAEEVSGMGRQNLLVSRRSNRYEGIIWENILCRTPPPPPVTAAMVASMQPSAAAQMIANSELSIARAAMILADPAVSPDHAAACLNQAAITDFTLPLLLRAPTMTPQRVAAILRSSHLTPSRAAGILQNSQFSLADIVNQLTSPNDSRLGAIFNAHPGMPERCAAQLLTELSSDHIASIIRTLGSPLPLRMASILAQSDNAKRAEIMENLWPDLISRFNALQLPEGGEQDTGEILAILNSLPPQQIALLILHRPEVLPYVPIERVHDILSSPMAGYIYKIITQCPRIIHNLWPDLFLRFKTFQLPRDTAEAVTFYRQLPPEQASLFLLISRTDVAYLPVDLLTQILNSDILPHDYITPLTATLPTATITHLISHLPTHIASQIISGLTNAKAAEVLSQVPLAHTINILRALPNVKAFQIMSSAALTAQRRVQILSNTSFRNGLIAIVNAAPTAEEGRFRSITLTAMAAIFAPPLPEATAATILLDDQLTNKALIMERLWANEINTFQQCPTVAASAQFLASFPPAKAALFLRLQPDKLVATLFQNALNTRRQRIIHALWFNAHVFTQPTLPPSTPQVLPTMPLLEAACILRLRPLPEALRLLAQPGLQERRVALIAAAWPEEVATYRAFQLPQDATAAGLFLSQLPPSPPRLA